MENDAVRSGQHVHVAGFLHNHHVRLPVTAGKAGQIRRSCNRFNCLTHQHIAISPRFIAGISHNITAISPRITAISPRITGISHRIMAISPYITAINHRLTATSHRITAISPDIAAIGRSIEPLGQNIAKRRDCTAAKLHPLPGDFRRGTTRRGTTRRGTTSRITIPDRVSPGLCLWGRIATVNFPLSRANRRPHSGNNRFNSVRLNWPSSIDAAYTVDPRHGGGQEICVSCSLLLLCPKHKHRGVWLPDRSEHRQHLT